MDPVTDPRCIPVPMAPSLPRCVQDLENTIGSWDMYGQDSKDRYNSLQSEFFERAASPINRREYLAGIVALGEP